MILEVASLCVYTGLDFSFIQYFKTMPSLKIQDKL
jgi:hypothetical protein